MYRGLLAQSILCEYAFADVRRPCISMDGPFGATTAGPPKHRPQGLFETAVAGFEECYSPSAATHRPRAPAHLLVGLRGVKVSARQTRQPGGASTHNPCRMLFKPAGTFASTYRRWETVHRLGGFVDSCNPQMLCDRAVPWLRQTKQ